MKHYGKFLGAITATVALSSSAFASNDVHYSIKKDESKANIKRTVEVILDERVDQPTLEHLAKQVKDSNSGIYQRTFIGWRIKG
jgi:hypothetical protein